MTTPGAVRKDGEPRSDNLNLDARGKPRFQPITDYGESKTVQSDVDKADIHEILRKYHQVGIIDSLNQAEAQYGDISGYTSYADLMRQVAEAEMAFMKLPSKVREQFDHDVAKWLDAANNPVERDDLVAEGIVDDLAGSDQASRTADAVREATRDGGAPADIDEAVS